MQEAILVLLLHFQRAGHNFHPSLSTVPQFLHVSRHIPDTPLLCSVCIRSDRHRESNFLHYIPLYFLIADCQAMTSPCPYTEKAYASTLYRFFLFFLHFPPNMNDTLRHFPKSPLPSAGFYLPDDTHPHILHYLPPAGWLCPIMHTLAITFLPIRHIDTSPSD